LTLSVSTIPFHRARDGMQGTIEEQTC
jgi:hypothetical protein